MVRLKSLRVWFALEAREDLYKVSNEGLISRRRALLKKAVWSNLEVRVSAHSLEDLLHAGQDMKMDVYGCPTVCKLNLAAGSLCLCHTISEYILNAPVHLVVSDYTPNWERAYYSMSTCLSLFLNRRHLLGKMSFWSVFTLKKETE